VSAFGGIEQGNAGERTYKRTLSWGGELGDSYDNGETARLVSERLWVFDMDARTESVIYGKHRAVGVPKDPVDDPYENFDDYKLINGITNSVTCSSTDSESFLAVIHQGKEVARKVSASPVNYTLTLKAGAGPLGLCPRLFSFDEVTENFIPRDFWTGNGGFLSLQQLRCWREDYFNRIKGSLCSRDPVNMMASFGFREGDYLNAAVYFNKQYDSNQLIVNGTLDQLEIEIDQGSLRFPPIRAV
jgi:hypothetical protein